MLKKSWTIIVLSCLVFGILMAVRYEIQGIASRAVVAALATVCLVAGIGYGIKIEKRK